MTERPIRDDNLYDIILGSSYFGTTQPKLCDDKKYSIHPRRKLIVHSHSRLHSNQSFKFQDDPKNGAVIKFAVYSGLYSELFKKAKEIIESWTANINYEGEEANIISLLEEKLAIKSEPIFSQL